MMLRTAGKYGLWGGVIVSGLMLLGFLWMQHGNMSNQAGEILGYASMIIALSMIFVGIKKYRDIDLGGQITFLEALKIGLVISIIASFIYVLTWMIYSNSEAASEMMDTYFTSAIEKIKNSGNEQAIITKDVDRMMRMKANYDKPLYKILYTFMEIFPVGVLISIISAFILKKNH